MKIKSINTAISLAAAGDSVMVHPGTYREGNILINKSLSLIGKNWPVIDGQLKVEVITVTAPHVTITGFEIINSGVSSLNDLAGIGAEDADYLIIKENHFKNNFFGVHLDDCDFATISHNIIRATLKAEYDSGNGIHLWKCTNALIAGNEIVNHRDGIYFEFVTESTVSDNLSEDNLRYGLHFMFSHHDVYKRNVFRRNGAGVAVMYTNFVEMYENSFEDNWGNSSYGLLLKDISDVIVDGNQFARNTVGVFMEGVNRGSFKNNRFYANGYAARVQANCEGNGFTHNNFVNNTFDIATNGQQVLNQFQYNYWDKYEGYDLNKDGVGDIPFRPVSMYSMVIDRIPTAVMLWRSFLVLLLDKVERVVPAVIPENLKDDYPQMKAYDLSTRS